MTRKSEKYQNIDAKGGRNEGFASLPVSIAQRMSDLHVDLMAGRHLSWRSRLIRGLDRLLAACALDFMGPGPSFRPGPRRFAGPSNKGK